VSRPVGLAEVRAVAADLVTKGAGAGKVALVDAEPRWTGAATLAVGGVPVEVIGASTVLAVHDALARRSVERLVLVLTDCTDDELGADVLARVVKHRRLPVEAWTLLRNRFGLVRDDALAPDLAGRTWLAEALVQHEPGEGWPALASAFLDRATAWSLVRRGWLALGTDDLAVVDVLAWATEPGRTVPLAAASTRVRDGVLAAVSDDAGAVAGRLVQLALDGRHDELVPLGLVADVLWAPDATGDAITAARVHLTYALEGWQPSAAEARAWGDAAVALVRRRLADEGRSAVEAWLVRAERLLGEIDAGGEAGRSDVLPEGFEQRMAAAVGLDEASARRAGDHLLADRDRLAGLWAAVRLARRVAPGDAPGTLAEAARRYAADGAFVDAARVALRQGERVPALAEAYTTMLAAVDAEREQGNRRFAELLAAWSTMAPGLGAAGAAGAELRPELRPIERVLDEVVAIVAADRPVLVVVLDGAGRSTMVDLAGELERAGWFLLDPAGGPLVPTVAALPTTTEVSRASLLAGRLQVGGAPVEKAAFSAHPGLKALRRRSESGPVLFHKGELMTADGYALASPVRSALADPTCRVVGVVVNAVDDHLERGQQVRVRWGLDTLAPLGALLADAGAARRSVVLTADHGHVLDDRRSALRPMAAGGERWRAADGPGAAPVGDGEVLLAGPRVLQGDGRIVAPWTEGLRYGGTKHGYHGGATPQEVLVPLVVAARADAVPEGWVPTRPAVPAWWDAPVAAPAVAAGGSPGAGAAGAAGAASTGRKKPPKAAPQADLFGGAPERAWIDALLASETWAAQRKLAGRAVLDDDRARVLLAAIDARGGVVARDVLAADTEIPPLRLGGTLTALRRLLNVEGYPVVDLGDDTVRLDKRLLHTQFGL